MENFEFRTKNDTWVEVPGMKKTRSNARAVDTRKGWWVTGTLYVSNITRL